VVLKTTEVVPMAMAMAMVIIQTTLHACTIECSSSSSNTDDAMPTTNDGRDYLGQHNIIRVILSPLLLVGGQRGDDDDDDDNESDNDNDNEERTERVIHLVMKVSFIVRLEKKRVTLTRLFDLLLGVSRMIKSAFFSQSHDEPVLVHRFELVL